MVDKIWYNMEELIGGSEERGINRNILECKDRDGQKIYTTDVVLIETYWNVKIINRENVITDEQRINRNILECKERYILHILDKFLVVLIETYWNVKKYTQTADLGYIPY